MDEERPALRPANVEDSGSSFMEQTLASPQLCTATDCGPCHIIRDLSAWNKLLFIARLELREQSPGELWLTSLDCIGWMPDSEPQLGEAFSLVRCLLKSHRCLAAIQLTSYWNEHPKFKDVTISWLSTRTHLKTLRVGPRKGPTREIVSALPSLNGLEELYFGTNIRQETFEPLLLLVETSSSLRILSLGEVDTFDVPANLIWDALASNSTLNTLILSSTWIRSEKTNFTAAFAECLKKNTTLMTLRIFRSGQSLSPWFYSIVDALGSTRSLENVFLQGFEVWHDVTLAIERILTQNSTIKTFNLEECRWQCLSRYESLPTANFGMLSKVIRPWVSILNSNHSLAALRLGFSDFTVDECVAFTTQLTGNNHLKKVTIDDFSNFCSFHLYRGVCQHFTVEKMNSLGEKILFMLSQKRLYFKVCLYIGNPECRPWFDIALQALISSAHLTRVELDFTYGDTDSVAISLLVGYIEKTSRLEELTILFHSDISAPAANNSSYLNILGALSQNTSVTKLFLKNFRFQSEEVAVLLANVVKGSRTIQVLLFDNPSSQSIEAFAKHLSPGFAQNFTIVSLRVDMWPVGLSEHSFAIKEVVRRNLELITRAAHFVAGNHTRRCVEAFELVSSAPLLLIKVSQLLSCSEEEAAAEVQECLRSIQCMDYFMRITEVVKAGVSCHHREDGRAQLDDLNEYTWLHLRGYLRVVDVAQSVPLDCDMRLSALRRPFE